MFLIVSQLFPISQLGQFSEGGLISTTLEIAAGVFAIALFLVSIFAWWRRGMQPTLLIVSFAFLAFFCKLALELIPLNILHNESVNSIMDLIILALFFFALVARPRRKRKNVAEDGP